jgi:hypothetical protein
MGEQHERKGVTSELAEGRTCAQWRDTLACQKIIPLGSLQNAITGMGLSITSAPGCASAGNTYSTLSFGM